MATWKLNRSTSGPTYYDSMGYVEHLSFSTEYKGVKLTIEGKVRSVAVEKFNKLSKGDQEREAKRILRRHLTTLLETIGEHVPLNNYVGLEFAL